MSIRVLCPFFDWVIWCCLFVSCMSSFCVSDINPLSGAWFTDPFPHFVGCIFTLLMVAVAMQKLFRAMGTRLCFYFFYFLFYFIFLKIHFSVYKHP